VSADSAVAQPLALVAVTVTLILDPASAVVSAYPGDVAIGLPEHPEPLASQRRHAKLNVGTPTPVHAPTSAVSVWPTDVVPEIVGGVLFVGAPRPGATPSVASEVVEPDP
jgi:hypothetical protein